MRQWVIRTLVVGLVLTFLWGLAQAQYGRQSTAKHPISPTDRFEEAVSLERFRQGNPDWDTQELIASGLTALHQEHQQILIRLTELKAVVDRLEQQR